MKKENVRKSELTREKQRLLWEASMLRLRPYNKSDAEIIMSWIKDERAFYKWTAGVLGEYPISEEQFNTVKAGDKAGWRCAL